MRYAMVLAAACTLLGCGTYSETGIGSSLDDAFVGRFGISRSGVTDTPLAADAYRIRGYGNQNASFEKTNAVAMIRAALLASEHGYDMFTILDFDTWEKTTTHSTPVTAHTSTNLNAYSYGGGYVSGHASSNTTFSGGEAYTLDRPRTDIVVRFVRNDSPEASRALRVADIISRYGKKAGMKPEEMQAAMSIAPIQYDSTLGQTVVEPMLASAPPIQESRPTPLARPDPQEGPTLDQIYKALTPAQKANVNSLPPARRAEYLERVRDGRY